MLKDCFVSAVERTIAFLDGKVFDAKEVPYLFEYLPEGVEYLI